MFYLLKPIYYEITKFMFLLFVGKSHECDFRPTGLLAPQTEHTVGREGLWKSVLGMVEIQFI